MTKLETRRAIKSLPHMDAQCHEGEWRVTVTLQAIIGAFPDKSLHWANHKAEAMACYTNDAEDALGTARHMSAHWQAMHAPQFQANDA